MLSPASPATATPDAEGRSPGAAHAATATTISVRASRETWRLPAFALSISSLSLRRRSRQRSHIRVVRSAPAFGYDPVDILPRILDVASLAVNAILRVDLQSFAAARRLRHDLIDPGRTIALLGRIVERIVYGDRQIGVLQLQMRGLILLMVGVRDED